MLKFEFDATWARDLAYHWLFALFVVFGLSLATPIAVWLQFNFNYFCDEPHCAAIAEGLRRSIDLHTDPCNNFYRFVCGRWALTNRPFLDQMSLHRHRFREELVAAILRREPRRHEQGAIDKAARLYRECRYQPFDDGCQLKSVAAVLNDLDITWPFAQEQSASLRNLSLAATLTKAHLRHGLNILYKTTVTHRGVKSKRKILLRIGHLLPLPEPLLSAEQLGSIVIRLATMMGSKHVDYKHLAELVKEQEDSLATFLDESQEWADENTLVTFEEAATTFPGYNWTFVMELIKNEVGSALTPQDHLYINDRAFEVASSVLKEGAAIHAFMGWRIVRMLTPMTCGLAGNMMARVAGGDVDVVSNLLAKTAFENLQEHMPMALAAPYINLNRPEESRENLQMYVARVMKRALEDGFYESVYISKNFRKRAARLIRHLTPHLLYPDYKHVESQIDHLYRHLPNFDGDCLNMTLTLLRESTRHRLRQLGAHAAIYGDGWEQPQTAVQPLYVMESDALFVPLGVAAPPLYTTGAPAPWKLGALGTVVGREITHKVLAFADSWEQLTTPEPPCFPNASLAYAFAVQAAYTALNLASHEGGTVIAKQRLRGLERFRDGQLLFLASCFTLCNADGEETARNEALCNEAMRNNRGFAKWFFCPQNSPMNPKDKCSF